MHKTTHGLKFGGWVIQNLTDPKDTQRTFRQKPNTYSAKKYGMKGAIRQDGMEVTQEFGNRQPDGVVIIKRNIERTDTQTDADPTDTVDTQDFDRSGGNTVGRMRKSNEAKKRTYKDIQGPTRRQGTPR